MPLTISRVISSILIVCILYNSAHSILGIGDIVFDPTNFTENLATAISTAEQIRMYTRDLSLLEDFSEYAEIITQVSTLAQQLLLLSGRLRGRYSRWIALIPNGGDFIPCTVAMLTDWNRRYDQDSRESIFDGGLAQTLASEGVNVLNSLPAILGIARSITGTVSGNQSLHSLLAQLLRSFTVSASMRAPMDEAESRTRMQTLIHRDAAQVLKQNRLAGIQGRTPQTCEPIPEL